ncbi:Uncharacterised protein [Mycobacteroides abscessus subsp. abscessus]|nr:Uncharacterised protein [Mycobacteroides abscessus subsp. abscessus]
MTAPGQFPDAEALMIALADPFGYPCTVLPETADGELDTSKFPIIWISRNGGSCDGITDRPIVQVGVMADTRAESWQVAGQLRDAVLASPGTSPGGRGLIDDAREITGVTEIPDFDPQNRLVQATYLIACRRRR